MRVLTLDAALDGCSAALLVDGAVMAVRHGIGGQGQAAILPRLAQEVLAGTPPASLHQVAVVVGPGSFTGIRAALALAHGIGLGAGVPVVGVATGSAFAAGTVVPDGWTLWTAIRARRGHVFLQRGPDVCMLPLDALPAPEGPVLVTGNAAAEVADRLAQGRHQVRRVEAGMPDPRAIAQAALLAPCRAEPLYIEAPRTTRPGTP